MSIWGTLNVGKTALAVNQAALQTVGNNIANAGNENYVRQRVEQVATKPLEYRPGLFIGTGVDIDDISRQIDESLENRLRSSNSDAEGDQASVQWLNRLEAVFNELGDDDLSTAFSQFFGSWSDLANKPQDPGLRQVVLQRGANLADRFKGMREQLAGVYSDANDRLKGYAGEVDELMGKVADLNGAISKAEATGGTNNGLRDERDTALRELSKLVNISVSYDNTGMANVSIGNDQVVIGTKSRGLTTENEVDEDTGVVTTQLVTKDTGLQLKITGGILGAVKGAREQVQSTMLEVDKMAGATIFELNKIHSSGQGLKGFSDVSAEWTADDADAALNSKEAGLKFEPKNGSFVVRVKNVATGAVTSTLVNVDLDGTGLQTTLNTLAADIDGIDNVTATVTGGRLRIAADSNAVEVSFSQDSSGVLASLGIGGFFEGKDASDIAVKQELVSDNRLLAASKNGQPGDNQTAKAIAALETTKVGALNDRTLKETYEASVNDVATRVSGARTDANASAAIRDTLANQKDAVSGVSLDEEAMNLMRYQRAYQAAARVISTADEMMQTILDIVR
jgi:flagellar hook-associated protein 1 FlgK